MINSPEPPDFTDPGQWSGGCLQSLPIVNLYNNLKISQQIATWIGHKSIWGKFHSYNVEILKLARYKKKADP